MSPEARARPVFVFFWPELLVQWLTYLPAQAASSTGATDVNEAPIFLRPMQQRLPLVTEWGRAVPTSSSGPRR